MSAAQITRVEERGVPIRVPGSGASRNKTGEPAVQPLEPVRRGIIQDERTLFFSEKY